MYRPNKTPRFALLIGAGDYTAFDASKRSNLPGATQDVASMYSLCHVLGIADENIHVLLSSEASKNPASALLEAYGRAQPGTIGRAKRADILAGFHWLASKLDAAMSASGPAPALVTWSGHGDFLRNELALCPADVASSVDGDDFVNAIGFDELRAFFERPSFANVTLVLDCCHAGASTDADGVARPSSLSGRAPLSSTNTAPIAARSICATTASGISAQSTFDGVSHGALTWALKVVTDQWSRRLWDNGDEITMSYGELKHRVNRVLEALSFSQRAQLAGPHVEALPFFHEGALGGDRVSRSPDRPRVGVQLEPDPQAAYVVYTLKVYGIHGAALFTGELISTTTASPNYGSSQPKYAANTEYLVQPNDPEPISDQTPGTDWFELVTYGGPLAFAKIEYSPRSVKSWESSDPYQSDNVYGLGASTAIWTEAGSNAPLENHTHRFYRQINGTPPGSGSTYAACASGVAFKTVGGNPAFEYALLANELPVNQYVVGLSVTTFDLLTPPPSSGCTCCESPAKCDWYKAT